VTKAGSSRPSRAAELAVLTGSKAVSNTAQRWVAPFLPTLERAFGSTTGTLTGVMGACELGGLTTAASGPALDRGHERRVFVLGTLAVAVSSVIALGGSVATFAVAYALVVIGVGNLTTAGHAWIGHRVPFAVRGRAIGTLETSWAIALLVGAPALAAVIELFGWRGPFVALAIAGGAGAALVLVVVSSAPPNNGEALAAAAGPLPRSAWPPIAASAATSAAGLGTFVVSGAWLDDAYGIPTAGLGLVAAGFGVIELGASTAVAVVGDRVGTRRSVIVGQLGLLAGVAVMLGSGESRAIAIGGLLLLLGGFEYAFVSSLTLVTEAAPRARGRAIGISNACGTVIRAGAVVASGQLYERFGMTGSLSLAIVATAIGLAMVVVSAPPAGR
jgi:predicted MFS family arabinose efflux permease